MKKLSTLILFFLFVLPAAISQIDYISVKDYMANLKTDKSIITVHAGKIKDYQLAHIAGSILFSYKDTDKPGDVKGLLQDSEDVAALLGAAGISNSNTIILYDGGTQKYSTRVYWILKYLGAENVLVLHKDLNTWRQSRIPLTSTATTMAPTTFEVKLNPEILATTDFVKSAIDNTEIVLIDVRALVEFDGTDGKSNGHIPSAININYEDFLTESGAFKTKEEITAITDKAGITSDNEVVLYCQTAIRGAVSYFVFKNILEYEKVRLYEGAIEEWQTTNQLIK